MKVGELQQPKPTLDEVIGLAKEGLVVLREPDGSVFALSQVDDFEVEVELLKKNPEFMAFFPLVPKLCLGTHSAKLRFANLNSNP